MMQVKLYVNASSSNSNYNDGNILASSSDDGAIKLWQIGGKLVRTFEGHSGGVRSICFSPDGMKLASASDDKTIKLWNLNGPLIKTFEPIDQKKLIGIGLIGIGYVL